jgi:raffinose/stachyose/melibiose transport system permease protein
MKVVKRVALGALYLALGFVFLYPVLLILTNSFKPYADIMGSFFSLPKSVHFDKYIETWKLMDFGKLFTNSGLYTVTVVAITVLAASMAGYMLARRKTRLSAVLFIVFMLPLMMPFQSIIISMTKLSKVLGFIGNAPG